ncbi:MAG: tyrosine-type recombinase/integrase [Pseudonocardiaceae bacterium]
MGHVIPTKAGSWRANWREPGGKQRSKTFTTKREATAYLTQTEATINQGAYVSPQGGRAKFGDLALRWLASRNDEPTTIARDASIMKTHVIAKWGGWRVGTIGHMDHQEWITHLGRSLAPATVAECHRLTAAVCQSAVRAKLIGSNPCDGARLPKRRKRDTDDHIITREQLLTQLLPAVPDRYRALVATAGGTGTRWGEAAGLCTDALDLDRRVLRVVRTVIEVSGHISFKPYPKSGAGRREIPLPAWLPPILREHTDRYPTGHNGLIFTNTAGGPVSRTSFRARIWRPSLVRAGLLGQITTPASDVVEAHWTDKQGLPQAARFGNHDHAVAHLARHATGAPTFHTLRHSYATWLVDDGVPVNMVQKVLGHEKSSTTLDLYTRKTSNHDRIREALDGPHAE